MVGWPVGCFFPCILLPLKSLRRFLPLNLLAVSYANTRNIFQMLFAFALAHTIFLILFPFFFFLVFFLHWARCLLGLPFHIFQFSTFALLSLLIVGVCIQPYIACICSVAYIFITSFFFFSYARFCSNNQQFSLGSSCAAGQTKRKLSNAGQERSKMFAFQITHGPMTVD